VTSPRPFLLSLGADEARLFCACGAQGTYYMGVFGSGNGSCSYLIRLTSTSTCAL
jgi:hypothetical protein